MADEAHEEPGTAASPGRRVDRRRTYNRRLDDREVSPPYFETFHRMALALEAIARALDDDPVTLPDVPTHRHADQH